MPLGLTSPLPSDYPYMSNNMPDQADLGNVSDVVSSIDAKDSLDRLNYWLNNLEKRASNGDSAAIDTLFNYYAQQTDLKTSRDWTASREDNQYQRLIADLQKAGISPYILSSATPAVSSAVTGSYSGSHFTSSENSKRTEKNSHLSNSTDIMTKIISLVGTALIALAMMA